MRLDKYLNDITALGRKQLRQKVKEGSVQVNGVVIRMPDYSVDPENDKVTLGGKLLSYQKYFYYMMNKPAGILTATEDSKQKTVLDLLPDEIKKHNLFPVGRLDKDTTGLLFLTNDGQFSHFMISPKHDVEKVYEVEYEGELEANAVQRFEEGICLSDGTKCKPATLSLDSPGFCVVTVTEGKYHQVKRMIAAVGGVVIHLNRVQFGSVFLDPALEQGEFRELSGKELCILMESN